MGVLVYGVWDVFFLCVSFVGLLWFHGIGLRLGILVSLGLRHRLLWFWVFGLRSSCVSFGVYN